MRITDTSLNNSIVQAELGTLRGAPVAGAKSKALPAQFTLAQCDGAAAVIITNTDTGRQVTVAANDLPTARRVLSALFG